MRVDTLLCSLTSLYSGEWFFGSTMSSVINPWKQCPVLSNESIAAEHKLKYSCLDHSYRAANYQPHDCSLLSQHDSLHHLQTSLRNSTKTKLMYVGDSLSKQLFISAKCIAEEFPWIDMIFFEDPFLREDYPCVPECISNMTFRNEQFHLLFSLCGGCLAGVHCPYNTTTRVWLRNVPVDETLALVLDGGTWFNIYKGIGDPDIYNDTLHKVGYACKLFRLEHGIPSFWIGLPPIPVDFLEVPMFETHPSWSAYHRYNQWAGAILSSYEVTYIDIETLLMQRKSMNPNITADGVHWW